jgi:hypothetical protein
MTPVMGCVMQRIGLRIARSHQQGEPCNKGKVIPAVAGMEATIALLCVVISSLLILSHPTGGY